MPRRKRSSSPCDLFDDDYDDDSNSQSSRNGHPPIQRNAANARERARMRVLSSAFGRLKTKLPNIPPDTKLSKLDTLRLATMYIKQLRALAEGSNTYSNEAINPTQFNDHTNLFGIQNGGHNLTWPFGLHHIQQNATNRQLPFHCSTTPTTSMDWSPPHEPMKDTRLADETTYHTQNHSHAPQLHAWYTTQNINTSGQSHNCHNNHFDVFTGFSQEAPHNQNQHTAPPHHHQQNTMSPIR